VQSNLSTDGIFAKLFRETRQSLFIRGLASRGYPVKTHRKIRWLLHQETNTCRGRTVIPPEIKFLASKSWYYVLWLFSFYVWFISKLNADHSDRAVWGMYSVRPLEHWDRELESHSRHGCLCAFILCIGRGLAMGWSPVQWVLPTV
jgi:hypothetical protein